jgi:hypothetical protein
LHDRLQRLDRLCISLELLAELLDTTEHSISQWIDGTLPIEEADVVEVGLSILEVRLARAAEQREQLTVRLHAVAYQQSPSS